MKPPPGWDSGFEFRGSGEEDLGACFEALFRRSHRDGSAARARGEDHHAKFEIELRAATQPG